MKIEATAQELRELLALAKLDAESQDLPPDTFQTRRNRRGKRLAKALFERYQTLLDVGRYPAIVASERGVCSGCHVRLPTMVESLVRRSLAVYSCPHCQRMLYAPEPPREESPRRALPATKAVSRRRAPAAPARRSRSNRPTNPMERGGTS